MIVYEKRIGEGQWKKIYGYLQEFTEIYVRNEESCRRFVEGVFWMLRSGAQWRMLPRCTVALQIGPQKASGTKILYYFSEEPDMAYIMVDSTILRAHACATPQKNFRIAKGWVTPVVNFRQTFMLFVMPWVTHWILLWHQNAPLALHGNQKLARW